MIHGFQRFVFIVTCAIATSAASDADSIANSMFIRIYNGSLDEYHDYSLKDHDKIHSKLIVDKLTVLYIHGYNEEVEDESVQTVVQGYLKRNDHNVIAVDYGKVAKDLYPVVALFASDVAAAIVKILTKLEESGSLNPEKFHIVGHSLGAQVAGYVGRGVNFTTSRITGLDPAGLFFNFILPELSSSDARFVDIIHTDYEFYGIGRSTGTVDFFPNNGNRTQPGCPLNSTLLSSEDFCSHHRSWRFYAESLIHESAFLGVQCPSSSRFMSGECNNNTLIPMGYGTPSNANGIVYLKTNDQSPFGLGEQGTKP